MREMDTSPPDFLAFEAWRSATPKEVSQFLKKDRPGATPSRRAPTNTLIVRSKLRPVDIYAYLRARFGPPNGFQNILRRDDSDNWIHWDFLIKAGRSDVYIAGASREIHFVLDEALTDSKWQALIVGLQSEFARLGRQKSEMTNTFEKFVVFQNKYVSLANVCAELHAQIVDTPPFEPIHQRQASNRGPQFTGAPVRRAGERAGALYSACVQLALLTPVMAEAYINMFALILRRPELRADDASYRAFVREHVPVRIEGLHEVCFGMGPVDRRSEAYGRFMTVMNKRNFNIHGNVEPERESLETVFFEGKRPLFAEPGHHLGRFFADLEDLHRPAAVIQDYEAVHAFLHELTTYLEPTAKDFVANVIDDPFPGFEVRKRRVTRILPDHVMMAMPQEMRCDDDLRVEW